MNRELVGEPGVSAFLQSVLRNLGGISWMKPSYHTYMNHVLTQDLEKLREKLVFFQGLVMDGEAKRLDDPGVDEWMDDINDLLYDVEDILDDIKILRKDPQVSVNHSLLKDINSRFKKILARAEKLEKKAATLKLKRVSIGHALRGGSKVTVRTRETSSVVDRSEIRGREVDQTVIVKRLLEVVGGKRKKNYDVLCIVGMGGLGKTTLAQLVFNAPEIVEHFDVKSWVCISNVFDVKRATKELIENSGRGGGDQQSLAGLQSRLKEMVGDKRFLFVLDDVWSSSEWGDMKVPFSSCANGSKILVTTRKIQIANALGNKKPYQLRKLNHKKCVEIFLDKAFVDDEGEEEKVDLVEKIVSACGGVPLVVKVIGSMLQVADVEKWRAVSENTASLANENDEIHPAIRFSFYDLPAYLKGCFQYLAIFPPDYLLKQDVVVRLWIADGLVEEKEGRTAEDIGTEYYNELKARSLIQENDMMHDIVHHLATLLSRKFCYKENSKELPASVRHAFLVNPNAMQCEFLAKSPGLRTLIVQGLEDDNVQLEDENVLRNTFRASKMLRTFLTVIGRGRGMIVTLSLRESSIDHWTHIRYLSISYSDMKHLSDSPCMLNNLQFLNLRSNEYLEKLVDRVNHLSNLRCLILAYTSISSLPYSICPLSQLQNLDLDYCRRLKELPKDIGTLRGLRTLHLRETCISSLPESICALSQLQVLNLEGCGSLIQLPKDIGNLKSLETLDLTKTCISSLPESICGLSKLPVLNLEGCRKLTQLPKDIGTLKSLRRLDLRETYITSLPESICALSQLQVLNLQDCRILIQLPKDIGTLRSLRILDLRKTCIKSLPESICALSQLQDLKLAGCRNLIQLPKDIIGNLKSLKTLDLGFDSISSLPESICSLSKLQVLNLVGCPNLIQLPEDIGNLRSLRTIDLRFTSISSVPESILNVTGLQYILVDRHKQLPLHIGRLARLKELPHYHVGKEEGRGLGELNLMNELQGWLRIANMENIGGVEEAKMADLKSKKNVWGLEFEWSEPGNDEEKEVEIMEALEPHHATKILEFSSYGGNKFPAWIMPSNVCFSKLTSLSMKGLNKIREMIDMEFVSLDDLKIENCPKLRKILMATPRLKRLYTRECGELEAASIYLLPSLSDKTGLDSILSRLKYLECAYNIFEYFCEKLNTANSKWDKLYYIKLSGGGIRIASLPGGWPSIMVSLRTMEIWKIEQGKFQFLPDGDQSAFPPALYHLYINGCEIMERLPHHSYTITSDGKVEL